MVRSVNQAEVSEKEFLSYSVYHYDSIDRIVEKAETFAARVAEEESLYHTEAVKDKMHRKPQRRVKTNMAEDITMLKKEKRRKYRKQKNNMDDTEPVSRFPGWLALAFFVPSLLHVAKIVIYYR